MAVTTFSTASDGVAFCQKPPDSTAIAAAAARGSQQPDDAAGSHLQGAEQSLATSLQRRNYDGDRGHQSDTADSPAYYNLDNCRCCRRGVYLTTVLPGAIPT